MSTSPKSLKGHSAYYGPLMMVASAICFSGGGIAMKMIPWNPLAINGIRNLIAMFVIGFYLKLTHQSLKLNRTIAVGAISMSGVTTLFTIANKMTTAGNAIILQYTCPIWIIIMMFLFFRQKPSRLDLITIGVVLLGILCFFFDSIAGGNILGDLIAVLAGVFYAGVFILNEFEEGDALSSMFFGMLLCGVCLTPMVWKETDFSPRTILAILFLGVIQIGIAYIFFAIGTKYTHPVTASLVAAIEPVLNPILVAIFWGEILTPLSLCGAAIVIIAVVSYNILKIRQAPL